MFEWFHRWREKEDPVEKELIDQVLSLWHCHNQLSEVVHQMSVLMTKLAQGSLETKDELEHLAMQTLRIVEQQNKLISHVMRSDDGINTPMESTLLH